MSKTEVDQAQWNSAQGVVRTVAQIMKDPARRRKLLELQKEAEPEAVIPELDSTKPVNDAIAGITDKIDKFIKTQTEKDEKRESDQRLAEFTARYEKGRSFIRSRGYDDESLKKIEKLMEDRGIADHEDGVTVFERLYPPPAPISSTFGNLDFLEKAKTSDADETMKRLFASRGEDELALNRMIDAARAA